MFVGRRSSASSSGTPDEASAVVVGEGRRSPASAFGSRRGFRGGGEGLRAEMFFQTHVSSCLTRTPNPSVLGSSTNFFREGFLHGDVHPHRAHPCAHLVDFSHPPAGILVKVQGNSNPLHRVGVGGESAGASDHLRDPIERDLRFYCIFFTFLSSPPINLSVFVCFSINLLVANLRPWKRQSVCC